MDKDLAEGVRKYEAYSRKVDMLARTHLRASGGIAGGGRSGYSGVGDVGATPGSDREYQLLVQRLKKQEEEGIRKDYADRRRREKQITDTHNKRLNTQLQAANAELRAEEKAARDYEHDRQRYEARESARRRFIGGIGRAGTLEQRMVAQGVVTPGAQAAMDKDRQMAEAALLQARRRETQSLRGQLAFQGVRALPMGPGGPADPNYINQLRQQLEASTSVGGRLSRTLTKIGREDLKTIVDRTREFGHLMVTFGGFAAVAGIVAFVKKGFELNLQYEKFVLTLQTALRLSTEVVDKNGKIVEGARAFEFVHKQAQTMFTIVRREANKTLLTTQEAMQIVQQNIGQAFRSGFPAGPQDQLQRTIRLQLQIGELVKMQNLRGGTQKLVQEERDLLRGRIPTRGGVVARLFGVTEEDLQRALKAGKMFDMFDEKFKKLNEELKNIEGSSQTTFSTLISKGNDFIRMSFAGTFGKIVEGLNGVNKKLTDEKVKEYAEKVSKKLADGFQAIMNFGSSPAFKAIEDLFKFMVSNAGTLIKIAEAFIAFRVVNAGASLVQGIGERGVLKGTGLGRTLAGAPGGGVSSDFFGGLGFTLPGILSRVGKTKLGQRVGAGLTRRIGGAAAAEGAEMAGGAVTLGGVEAAVGGGAAAGGGIAALGGLALPALAVLAAGGAGWEIGQGVNSLINMFKGPEKEGRARPTGIAAARERLKRAQGERFQIAQAFKAAPFGMETVEVGGVRRTLSSADYEVAAAQRSLTALQPRPVPGGGLGLRGVESDEIRKAREKERVEVHKLLAQMKGDKVEELKAEFDYEKNTLREKGYQRENYFKLVKAGTLKLTEDIRHTLAQEALDQQKHLARMSHNKRREEDVDLKVEIERVRHEEKDVPTRNRRIQELQEEHNDRRRDEIKKTNLDIRQIEDEAAGNTIQKIKDEGEDRKQQYYDRGLSQKELSRAYVAIDTDTNRKVFLERQKLTKHVKDLANEEIRYQRDNAEERKRIQEDLIQLQRRTMREEQQLIRQRVDSEVGLQRAIQNRAFAQQDVQLSREQRGVRQSAAGVFRGATDRSGMAENEKELFVRQLGAQVASGDLQGALQEAAQRGIRLDRSDVNQLQSLAEQGRGTEVKKEKEEEAKQKIEEKQRLIDANKAIFDYKEQIVKLNQAQSDLTQQYAEQAALLKDRFSKSLEDGAEKMREFAVSIDEGNKAMRQSGIIPVSPASIKIGAAEGALTSYPTSPGRGSVGQKAVERAKAESSELKGVASLNINLNGANLGAMKDMSNDEIHGLAVKLMPEIENWFKQMLRTTPR